MNNPSLHSIGSGELEQLLRQLQDPDPVLRGQAALSLGQRGDQQARSGIKALLDDPDVIVGFKAAQALSQLKDAAGLSILLQALSNQDLCFAALESIADLGSAEALPHLQRFFDRRFIHVLERLQTAAAMVRCGDAQSAAFIRKCLQSPRLEERGFALELWGRLQMPDALDLLQGVAADPNDHHRMDAVRGLCQLGDVRCLPVLDRISRDDADADLQQLAIEASQALRANEKTQADP